MTTMDIKLLRTLVAFSDTGSCLGAAKNINRTPAAVSVHLKRLEDAVGKELFEKDGRRLRLNSDGQNLVSYGRRIIRLHNEALATFNKTEFTGTLRIGLPDDYISLLLTPMLRALEKTLPKAQIELLCAPSASLRPMLKNNELDIAVLSSETDTQEGYVLRQETTHWIASSGYKHDAQQNLKLLLFPDGCILRKWALNALKNINLGYEIACTSHNMQALKTAMSHGLGIMVATKSNVPDGSVIVSEDSGLPSLPDVTIMLVANKDTDIDIIKALYQDVQNDIGWG